MAFFAVRVAFFAVRVAVFAGRVARFAVAVACFFAVRVVFVVEALVFGAVPDTCFAARAGLVRAPDRDTSAPPAVCRVRTAARTLGRVTG